MRNFTPVQVIQCPQQLNEQVNLGIQTLVVTYLSNLSTLLKIIEYQIRLTVSVKAILENLDNIGMMKRRQKLKFIGERQAGFKKRAGIFTDAQRQHFERDVLSGQSVDGMIDLSIGTLSDTVLYLITIADHSTTGY